MKRILLPVSLLLTLTAVGCFLFDLTGGEIDVSGQPFDLVILQLDSAPAGACCPNCLVSAPVPLDSNGSGSHSGLVDGDGYAAEWLGTGLYSGCVGTTTLGCLGSSSLSCQATSGNVTAYGSITLTDNGTCIWNHVMQIRRCPAPTLITLTINGVQVSYSASVQINSTDAESASAAASGLATAINNTSSLVGVVVAGSSGSLVEITGSQGSANPATLDLYPWSISMSQQNGCNGGCTFSASLTPLQTMGTRPPL